MLPRPHSPAGRGSQTTPLAHPGSTPKFPRTLYAAPVLRSVLSDTDTLVSNPACLIVRPLDPGAPPAKGLPSWPGLFVPGATRISLRSHHHNSILTHQAHPRPSRPCPYIPALLQPITTPLTPPWPLCPSPNASRSRPWPRPLRPCAAATSLLLMDVTDEAMWPEQANRLRILVKRTDAQGAAAL